MRKIVLQMMTTLAGRLDDPMAWVHGVGDDQYRDIDQLYAAYDTVLVGRTTYEEMAAYWPDVLASGEGGDTNRAMARRMHDYRKLVFSKSGSEKLTEWNNTELVVPGNDDDLAKYLTKLKGEPGRHIHLSGGASFAQAVVALGLVDALHFFVYPAVSPGASWFARWPDRTKLRLLGSKSYGNGVVRLDYAADAAGSKARPQRFSELLA